MLIDWSHFTPWAALAGGLALGLKLRALAPVWSRAAGGAIALLGLGLLTRLVIA